MELIQTVTVGSGGASAIELTPTTAYDDLYIVYSLRAEASGTNVGAILFNGSSANFSLRLLQGDGSGVSSASYSANYAGIFGGSTMTANTFGNTSIYIPNYRSSAAKSFSVDAVTENNATLAYQNIQAGLWNNSAAITSISISFLSGGNWAQGSSASLYGIRKFNTSAQPKATGGAISFDAVNNKWVHVFSTSGTFTPTANITCEYLVVAGGGGGQSFNSGVDWGRGGAGGFPTTSSSSFTSSANYTVTVGGGGAGGTGNAGSPGTAGSSSSLSGTGVSVTSSGGQGGNTTSSPNRSEFGGGNVNAGVNGYGGVGLTTTITGASIKYSGGGAKGILNSPRPSDDGSNYGGGLRLTNSATISNPVVANRAGGGSGGQNTGDGGFFAGEAGSSGLVVIRYDA